MWRLGARAAAVLVATLLALDVLALRSTDPDFYLPDLFRPLSIATLAVFAATGFVHRRTPRRALRTVGFVVVGALLLLELRARYADLGPSRIMRTSDRLLRYHYRPGYAVTLRDGSEVTVNSRGLLDVERAVPKPADVFRVAVLTGSIANDGSIPFESRFFRQLERQLDGAVPGKRVEVINVSCEGYNTVQQVRLLERVGLAYQPDAVVVAYMLSAASLQNGAYRRFGNSFFLFRFLPMIERASTGTYCSMFAPFHDAYSFDLIVRNSFERLAMLGRAQHVPVLVAVLPVVERFDDPTCARIYDQVTRVARESGLPAVRVADAFAGEPYTRYAKPDERDDVCHPNPAGHRRIAESIAGALRPLLRAPSP